MTFCTADGANAFNGINAWLLRFLPALRTRGHDARALIFPWSRPEHCTTLPLLRDAAVPTDAIYPIRDTESAVSACLRHVRRFAPDVFVANMVIPALFAGRWIRATGIPTVAMLHNDDAEYRAKAAVFAGMNEDFRVSALVAISPGLKRLAEPAPNGLILRCIPYGLRIPATRAAWNGLEPLRLVYHGRIVQEQKRIVETIGACVRIARATGRVTADFFGSGPDEAAVRDLLAADNAGGRVRFLGSLNPRDVVEKLAGYHVAVLLSDYEGLGLSIMEGMAAGLVPVCLRTHSGLPDLITHETEGLFVNDREADFDAAILRLLSEPATWTRLAEAAQLRIALDFSEVTALDAWESLLSSVANQETPRSRIKSPWFMNLPPVHPDLRHQDSRYPGLARALWRRIRFPDPR